MTNYQETRFKLTNKELNKSKSASKIKAGTILRITKKKFQDEELPYGLFLTTRHKTKMQNAVNNNISTNIKLSRVQIPKAIQSGVYFDSINKFAFSLAKDNLPRLVNNVAWNAVNKFERKISGKGAVRAGKVFTLFNLNEDLNYNIEILESLEDSSVLIGGITETVKHRKNIKKNKEADFLKLC